MKEITVKAGDSVELPKVILTSSSGAKNSLHQTQWSSADSKVAKIKDSKLVAVKEGKTAISINVNGTTLKVEVQVVPKSSKSGAALETLDDYSTPLGMEDAEFFIVDDEGAAFEDENGLPEADE